MKIAVNENTCDWFSSRILRYQYLNSLNVQMCDCDSPPEILPFDWIPSYRRHCLITAYFFKALEEEWESVKASNMLLAGPNVSPGRMPLILVLLEMNQIWGGARQNRELTYQKYRLVNVNCNPNNWRIWTPQMCIAFCGYFILVYIVKQVNLNQILNCPIIEPLQWRPCLTVDLVR